MDHVLSELSAMTCLSWVALHGMTHSFTELHKPLCHNKTVIREGYVENVFTIPNLLNMNTKAFGQMVKKLPAM